MPTNLNKIPTANEETKIKYLNINCLWIITRDVPILLEESLENKKAKAKNKMLA